MTDNHRDEYDDDLADEDPVAIGADDGADGSIDPDATSTSDEMAGPTGPAEQGGGDATIAHDGPTAVEQLARRTNVLVGLLAVLLIGTFIVIGLLFGRVADAEADAEAARNEVAALNGSGGASSQELDEIRAELERVEAGAALYASQVTGFQEQLVALEPQVSAGVEEAITGLRDFGDSTISFDVNIDEVIPIRTDVVIDRVIEVPIKTTIPINETIDTTIDVSTPLGDIPIDVSVPVDVDVPIDLVVEIPINETVEIDEEFPVQLDVPIAIEVGETELANLTDSLAAGLESLRDVLTSFG